MFDPIRWPREAAVPLLAGLAWTAQALDAGLVTGLPALAVALLLSGSGGAMLLHPGDRRVTHYTALGGVLGVLFALVGLVFIGPFALLLGGLSAATFLVSGHHALRLDPHPESVPAVIPSLRLSAETALDEAMLGVMAFSQRFPSAADHRQIVEETQTAIAQFEEAGWIDKPEGYHEAPPAPDQPLLRRRSTRGIDYEHLSFASEYEPREGEPGRERWQAQPENQRAHAWVLRGDPDKPWLMCIHGYRMGQPLIDLSAFRPDIFHDKLGMNLILPVLPLHGVRGVGRRSGDGFLEGNLLDSIHAEAQAMWDLRRCLAWVRGQGGRRIGAYGLSLGGYTASLLSCLDDDLACVIAGIPATDFSRIFMRHSGPWQQRFVEHVGLDDERMRRVLRVVSPLVLETKVPHEHRAIFGGVVDRLVPPDQVRDLWRHWQQPRIAWYQGSHLTFPAHLQVRTLVDETLRGAGLVEDAGPSAA